MLFSFSIISDKWTRNKQIVNENLIIWSRYGHNNIYIRHAYLHIVLYWFSRPLCHTSWIMTWLNATKQKNLVIWVNHKHWVDLNIIVYFISVQINYSFWRMFQENMLTTTWCILYSKQSKIVISIKLSYPLLKILFLFM